MDEDDRAPGEEGWRQPDEPAESPYAPLAPRARPPALPPALQNWQVVEGETAQDDAAEARAPQEIEGEATLVAGAPATDTPGREADGAQAIPDRVDDLIIVTLPTRALSVRPGATATLPVELLNNSAQPAHFDLHVEGWIDESWLNHRDQHLLLGPGERATLQIAIAPPRRPTSSAGEYPFAVVTRSPEHPRRVSRLGARLTVQPYVDFTLGRLQPARAAIGPLRRQAAFVLPVANLGNDKVALQVRGQAVGADCLFVFRQQDGGQDQGQPQANTARIELEAQQTAQLEVRVGLRSPAWFGAGTAAIPISVAVGAAGQSKLPRTASAELVSAPLVRPWHLLLGGGLLMAAMLAALVLAFGAQLYLRMAAAPAQLPAASAPAPAQPIVIVLNQLAPTPASAVSPAGAAPAPLSSAEAAAEIAALPVVSADQVTGPGTPAPIPSPQPAAPPDARSLAGQAGQPGQAGAVQPAPAAPPHSPGDGLTYAQMFQEIALRYDLDWRALAAQAYVESSFDALALGNDGDMGLMQILPPTWREWAPAVEANDPFDAYSNALVAAAYLDYLRTLLGKRGLPEIRWMLVAYNWGPDKLAEFLDGGGTWESLPATRRRYADDILRIAATIP